MDKKLWKFNGLMYKTQMGNYVYTFTYLGSMGGEKLISCKTPRSESELWEILNS